MLEVFIFLYKLLFSNIRVGRLVGLEVNIVSTSIDRIETEIVVVVVLVFFYIVK